MYLFQMIKMNIKVQTTPTFLSIMCVCTSTFVSGLIAVGCLTKVTKHRPVSGLSDSSINHS